MRKLLIAGLVAMSAAMTAAAPAIAQGVSDTLQEVTTRGVILKVQGYEIPITYKEDGSFTLDAMGQTVSGKWRVDGAKLCTSSDMQPDERCTEYPAGKKSGDEFEVQGAMGAMTVKIN